MAKLIITADDYGMSEEVNDGIRECIKIGAVTSVHVLTNLVTDVEMQKLQIAVDQAAVKFDKRCGIGLHFNTTHGKPLVNNSSSSLVAGIENNSPVFYTIKTIDHDKITDADLLAEFNAQLKKLADYIGGYDQVDAISSHHNIHFFSERFTNALLNGMTEEIPFRSPVQWRSPEQVPQPRKFKKWYEILPIVLDSTRTFQQAIEGSTKWILNNAMTTSFLVEQRQRMELKHHKTPINSSEQWYGQPDYDCLFFIIKEMERLQMEYDMISQHENKTRKPYISELFTHIASSEGNVQLDLTYSMPRRVAEYHVWKTYKVKKLLEECHNGFHGVELCSYRSAM